MAEPRVELANAVQEALDWLGMSPEDAAPVIGMNARTLAAMAQGIVPMRSLVIKLAAGMERLRQTRPGAADWWGDVDAWLKIAGYPPRREASEQEHEAGAPAGAASSGVTSYRLGGPAGSRPSRPADTLNGNGRYSSPPQPYSGGSPERTGSTVARNNGPAVASPPPARPNGGVPASHPAADSPVAAEAYHPQYERLAWGDSFVHVFWILDGNDRRVFQIRVAPNYDYKARAAEVKRDLAALTRSQFDRKYGRFRVDHR